MAPPDDLFLLALRAFALMTPAECLQVLERMAHLRYPVIADRFHDAVHHVIQRYYDGEAP